MFEYRYFGAVYIFENPKAQRVKVGVTVNDVVHRLRAINQVWLERKVTCQICGARFLDRREGQVPEHGGSVPGCPGGGKLALEKDVAVAESYLENMKRDLSELSGSKKGSVARRIKTLAKRIELYRDYEGIVGSWRLSTTFYTESAGRVESLAHEILAEHLDREAPVGEVFCCSVSVATEAVESALRRLGLLDSARKEIKMWTYDGTRGNEPGHRSRS